MKLKNQERGSLARPKAFRKQSLYIIWTPQKICDFHTPTYANKDWVRYLDFHLHETVTRCLPGWCQQRPCRQPGFLSPPDSIKSSPTCGVSRDHSRNEVLPISTDAQVGKQGFLLLPGRVVSSQQYQVMMKVLTLYLAFSNTNPVGSGSGASLLSGGDKLCIYNVITRAATLVITKKKL